MKLVRTWYEAVVFAFVFGAISDWPGIFVLIRHDKHLLPLLDTFVMAVVGWLILARTDGSSDWFKSGLYLSLLGGLLWCVLRSLAIIHEQPSPMFLVMASIWSLSAGVAWCVCAGSLRTFRKWSNG